MSADSAGALGCLNEVSTGDRLERDRHPSRGRHARTSHAGQQISRAHLGGVGRKADECLTGSGRVGRDPQLERALQRDVRCLLRGLRAESKRNREMLRRSAAACGHAHHDLARRMSIVPAQKHDGLKMGRGDARARLCAARSGRTFQTLDRECGEGSPPLDACTVSRGPVKKSKPAAAIRTRLFTMVLKLYLQPFGSRCSAEASGGACDPG